MTTGRSGFARYRIMAAGLCLALAAGAGRAAQEDGPDPTAGLASSMNSHPATDESCERCHAPARTPVVDPDVIGRSVHADQECVECHTDIERVPHDEKLRAVDCGTECHKKSVRQIKLGAHAEDYVNGHKGFAPSPAESDRRAAGGAAGTAGGAAVGAEEEKEPPTCADCHGAHDVAEVKSIAFRDVIAGRCKECHEERYLTYMDRFHGKAGVLGMETAPRCPDCHTGHKQLPADDPKSSVHTANLVETCGECHKTANENFVRFDPHPQPHNKEHSALVYWWWVFMVGLIVGTFGFFGVHDLLWLQRIVVAYLRNEVHPRPASTGPWVRRFTWTQSLSHVVLNVTFMLLALTGLPLMYAEAQWAKRLAWVFGGEPVMRYIHFTSATLFFGYFLIHVGGVFWRYIRARDSGIFWGVNSLVPWGPDFVDMYRNLKWFLYLGEKPKLDRWTYWEKFDYWAVFWGMAIIGISGAMMANAELYARALPGEWLNVAAVIHGEEALLAVGFITFFHFFHNHLRPENFPMDITVFTGRQPLERFKEERPVQYERVVREGLLDRMIVPPPSRLAVVLWTIYGAILIFLGFFLSIAVIYTMLT